MTLLLLVRLEIMKSFEWSVLRCYKLNFGLGLMRFFVRYLFITVPWNTNYMPTYIKQGNYDKLYVLQFSKMLLLNAYFSWIDNNKIFFFFQKDEITLRFWFSPSSVELICWIDIIFIDSPLNTYRFWFLVKLATNTRVDTMFWDNFWWSMSILCVVFSLNHKYYCWILWKPINIKMRMRMLHQKWFLTHCEGFGKEVMDWAD